MDFADILIVVGAVISMIVTAISKNAKKKAEAQHKHNPSLPQIEEFEEDQWEDPDYGRDVFGRPVYDGGEARKPEVAFTTIPTPTIVEQRELWSYDTQAINAINSTPEGSRKSKASKAKSSPKESQVSEYDSENGSNDHEFIKDFKLRDAIIYSELLKPKFKEY